MSIQLRLSKNHQTDRHGCPDDGSWVEGGNQAADQCLDSLNVIDALLGKQGAKGRASLVQQDNGGSNLGFRVGDWKLVRARAQHKEPDASGNVPDGKSKKGKAGARLYHRAEDPAENTNLADKQPEKLAELSKALDAIIDNGRSR